VPVITVVFGVLLIALGVWGYFGGDLGLWAPLGVADPGGRSGTALIPAGLGAVFVVLGLLALKEKFLKHAMHAAALLGVIGFLLAGWRVLLQVVKGKVEGVAGVSTSAMTVLCGVFVGLCVNSFIAARRRRRAREALSGP
jgi:hypothetical protein